MAKHILSMLNADKDHYLNNYQFKIEIHLQNSNKYQQSAQFSRKLLGKR